MKLDSTIDQLLRDQEALLLRIDHIQQNLVEKFAQNSDVDEKLKKLRKQTVDEIKESLGKLIKNGTQG